MNQGGQSIDMGDLLSKIGYLLFGKKVKLIFDDEYYGKWDWCRDDERKVHLVISKPEFDERYHCVKYMCKRLHRDS